MLTARRLYRLVLWAAAGGYLWLGYTLFQGSSGGPGVCLIKEVTGVPCPSCGTTRAIEALAHGNLQASFLLNPFGLLVFALMMVIPVWVVVDLLTGRTTFYRAYLLSEQILRRKYIAIPLAILVLLNWVWNIMKGL